MRATPGLVSGQFFRALASDWTAFTSVRVSGSPLVPVDSASASSACLLGGTGSGCVPGTLGFAAYSSRIRAMTCGRRLSRSRRLTPSRAGQSGFVNTVFAVTNPLSLRTWVVR